VIHDHSADMARDARNNLVRAKRNARRRLSEFIGSCAGCGLPITELDTRAAVMHLGTVAVIHRGHCEEWPYSPDWPMIEAEPEDVVKALGHEVEPGVWR